MNKIYNEQLNYCKRIKEHILNNNLKLSYKVVTFGCQMNAKDSEKLAGILEKSFFYEINDENLADVVIFNTCTVRENVNERLYGRIGQLKKSCANNRYKIIGICGCMMQEEDEVIYISNKYPYVKLFFGVYNLFKFSELLYNVLVSNQKIIAIEDDKKEIVENLPTKNKYNYKCGINIMTGCNNFCSYCIVPYVRGREKSRTIDDILDEVKLQIKNGVKEIMLLGQNVNS